MLITWARLIWRFLRLLVVEAPPDRKIDRNAKCAGCGHRLGLLACVHHDGKVLIEHTCVMCGARFYEFPIMENATTDILLASKLSSTK